MISNLPPAAQKVRPFAPADASGLFLVPPRAHAWVRRPGPHGVPRPASFQMNGPQVAPADSGVAVFGAMLSSTRAIGLPALPPGLPFDWHAMRAGVPAAGVRRCPSCGWLDIRRSVVRSAADYVLSVMGWVPYRCRSCGDRFHVVRRSLRTAAAGICKRYL